MPKRPSSEYSQGFAASRNPALDEASRRTEGARKSGSRELDLSNLALRALPGAIGQLSQMDIFLCLVSYEFLASDYIQSVELPGAEARHRNGEIEVVPVVLCKMDLDHDCKFLHGLNPLPEWGKSWQAFRRWNDALYPIGNGLKQAIEKVRAR